MSLTVPVWDGNLSLMGVLADPKIVKEREATCSTCPKHDVKQDRCKACKCFLKLKNKLLNSKCPEGKWKR